MLRQRKQCSTPFNCASAYCSLTLGKCSFPSAICTSSHLLWLSPLVLLPKSPAGIQFTEGVGVGRAGGVEVS